MSELSLVEKHELVNLEGQVEMAKDQFYRTAGAALFLIREKKLWRADYESFDDYCLKRWKWTRNRADQLILAVKVVNELPTDVGKHIDNEASARALSKVPSERRAEVVEKAAEGGKVTAPIIAKTAARLAAPAQAVDPTGRKIHPTVMDLWNRRDELTPFATQVSQLKCFIEGRWEQDDPIFMRLHQDILLKLKSVHYLLSVAKLEYICGFCQGTCKVTQQHCQNCHGTGLMTKYEWDHIVPEQLKRKP